MEDIMKKVKVDESKCIGCGACASTAPDYFEFDSHGLSKVKQEVVAEDDKTVTDAMESCPVAAISVCGCDENCECGCQDGKECTCKNCGK